MAPKVAIQERKPKKPQAKKETRKSQDARAVSPPDGEIHVPILSDADIVSARTQGRDLAQKLGFSGSDLTVIIAAISEVSRNIVEHATKGEVLLGRVLHGSKRGILVVASDKGPGIPDVRRAMQQGFSTGKGLGMGLPGAQRLVDEFEIVSRVGSGTTVTMRKWLL